MHRLGKSGVSSSTTRGTAACRQEDAEAEQDAEGATRRFGLFQVDDGYQVSVYGQHLIFHRAVAPSSRLPPHTPHRRRLGETGGS